MIYATVGDLISYVPQIVKIIKTKEAEDLSIWSWTLWVSTSISETIYYVYIADIFILLQAIIGLICNFLILILTLKYGKRKNR